jgi:hypothetical protein
MSLIFLRFIPDLQHNFPGLIQRFFNLGWSVWFVSLSFCFLQLIQRKNQDLPHSSPAKPKKEVFG